VIDHIFFFDDALRPWIHAPDPEDSKRAARRSVVWSGRASLTGMRARRRFPTSRAIMASNPVLSTTTKRRFRQRIVLPGVKATDTAITLLEYARSKRTKRFLVGFRIPQP
jgi:hypothetical protein